MNDFIIHRALLDKNCIENSITSIEKCINKNMAFEIDLHILKDNEVIVFHDDNLLRMTGLDRYIRECTFNDIKLLYLNNSNEHIPTLDDVLKITKGKVLIDIELKFDNKRFLLEKRVIEKLQQYDGDIIISTFDYKAVNYLKKKTNYKIGLILPDKSSKEINVFEKIILEIFDFMRLCKPDYIICSLKDSTEKRIIKFRDKGNKIILWTIKNLFEYDLYKQYGDTYLVENII